MTRALAAAAACALAAAAFAGDGPTVVRGADVELIRAVKSLADRVANVRGKDAPVPPPLALRASADERRAALAAALAERGPGDARLAARGRAWEDLGLSDAAAPASLRRRSASDLPGAFLDPSGRRLLIDPSLLTDADFSPAREGDDAMSLLLVAGVRPDEPLLCHYLEHAWDRSSGTSPLDEETTDGWLAREAWDEGRANLAALLLLFDGVGLGGTVLGGGTPPSNVLDGSLVPSEIRDGSPLERSFLYFIYEEGYAQAAARAKAGGWGALSRVASERRTTRSVLHPEAPGGVPEPPPLPEPGLPSGYSVADRDSLGEQGIVTLVSRVTGKDNLGLLAGDAWAADALYRLEPAGGDPGMGATVWVIRARDEAQAGEVEYGLGRMLEARGAPAGERRATIAGRRHEVLRTGVDVVYRVLPPSLENFWGEGAGKRRYSDTDPAHVIQ